MTRKQVNIIAENEKIKEIITKINKIVHSDSSVLLVGETGVGKEIFAEYIHQNSHRKDRPFVKIGLAAMPTELLESELFGHEKGSFTSANEVKKGLFEIAHTGSIFLDDIDDVPMAIQTKLLRVLESREMLRVGGTTPIPIDVRLITASKVDLRTLVERQLFRSDLYYRINVVPLFIPPLRERREEIIPLVKHFLNHYSPEHEIKIIDDAERALQNYSWPGNIRELRNIIQRISLFVDGEITIQSLPYEIRNEDPIELLMKACDRCFIDKNMSFDDVVSCLEANLLRQAMRNTDGNQSRASKLLNMSLSTFRDKLKKYNIHNTLSFTKPCDNPQE